MQRVEKLPPAFGRLRQAGAVLDIAAFEGSRGTEDEILAAVPALFPQGEVFDRERLRSLGRRRIGERAFFGDWFDPDDGALIRVGRWRTDADEEFRDPKLKDLDRVRIISGSGPLPDPGSGGQFAYALTCPPYPLQAQPGEVQSLFNEVREFILPRVQAGDIFDWSSPRLPEVSDYFVAGMEWWGMFLFSIYVPALQRLTVVAGSATD